MALSHPSANDEAHYWLKHVLHNGWPCITSSPAFFIQGDVDIYTLFMHAVCQHLCLFQSLIKFLDTIMIA